MEIKNVLSVNLKRVRSDRGLTQSEVASMVNLSVQRIRDIESGRGNPSINSLTDLAEKLGVKVSELLEGEGSPTLAILPKISRVLEMMSSIPDEIYYLAEKIDKKNEVWETIKVALEVEVNRLKEEALKTKKA